MTSPTVQAELVRKHWQQGITDIDIARQTGLSRERVRQLRQGLEREWERPSQVATKLGVSESAVRTWMARGYLEISPSGLIKCDEAEALRDKLRERECQYEACEQPVLSVAEQVRFCSEHREVVKRYRYHGMTVEQRRKFRASVYRWRERRAAEAG